METSSPVDGFTQPAMRSSRLDTPGLVSAILIGIIGALVIFITPGFLAVVAQQSGLDNEHLGYIASWDINAMAVTIGLSTFVLSRWRWRWTVAAGLGLIVLGNLATAVAAGYHGIAVARIIAGAGEGIAIGFAFAALGRASNPDRAFSIYLVAGAFTSSAILYTLPALQAVFSPQMLFIGNAALTALIAICLPFFPEGRSTEDDVFTGGGVIHWRLATGVLVSVFLYFFANGAIWGYAERIGSASGIAANTIAWGLSLGTLAGVAGAATAGMLPQRWGRTWPLLISGGISVCSFLMLLGHVSSLIFIAAAVLMLYGWNFAQPLLSGICCEADEKGRVVCAMGSIQTFGTGLGPAAAAATLAGNGGSFSLSIWSSSAILIVGLVVVLVAIPRTA